MTANEAQAFLEACVEVCPDYYPLFFTALRSGLRKSELIALKWGDIQFGESEDDKNRFILVQRHYYMGHFGTSKTHECRRVDMSKQLRAVLMAYKENALLRAFQLGKMSVVDELVFPSEARTPICPDNIGPRYMEPALETGRAPEIPVPRSAPHLRLASDPGRRLSRLRPEADGAPEHSSHHRCIWSPDPGRKCGLDRYSGHGSQKSGGHRRKQPQTESREAEEEISDAAEA